MDYDEKYEMVYDVAVDYCDGLAMAFVTAVCEKLKLEPTQDMANVVSESMVEKICDYIATNRG